MLLLLLQDIDSQIKKLPSRLKELMSLAGVSRKELSSLAGIKLQRLDNYLYEPVSIPAADVAFKLATVLNTTVEYLLTGTKAELEEENDEENKELLLAKKYKQLNEMLEQLPTEAVEHFSDMVKFALFTDQCRKKI